MYSDKLEHFERYARAAGANVTIASGEVDAAALVGAISGLVDGPLRCTDAVRTLYPVLYQLLETAGPAEVAEDISQAQPDRTALALALAGGTGIVAARAGVAETGSLVLADDALAPRLLSMLAEECIALLPASVIVPSLDEAGALLAEFEQAGHRYVSLVTGPSRTADIERVLTIGVQGPKALHVIVIEES